MSTRIKVEMKPVNTILARLGVNRTGDVQQFVTSSVNRRLTKYMPFRSGALATKLKFVKSPTEIEVLGPYARVMYYGVVMVDPKTGAAGFLTKDGWKSRRGIVKVPSDRAISYDRTKNPLAGPLWDKRMMANEKDQIVADVQDYVNRRKK